MKEIILIILCIILYGSATFFKRLGLAQLHPYQFLLLASIFYATIIPYWIYLINKQTNIVPFSISSAIFTLIYAAFSIVAGLILAFLLRETKTPGSLIVMTNLSSLVTLLLTFIFLKEQLNLNKIIAIGLAITSLFLINC